MGADRIVREFWMDMYTLLYLKWIANEDLLYSPGMLWGSLDGKGVWGRLDTCIHVAGSLCCSPETITTLLIGSVCVHVRACVHTCSVMSDCLQPPGLQPARLLCPQNFPGKKGLSFPTPGDLPIQGSKQCLW